MKRLLSPTHRRIYPNKRSVRDSTGAIKDYADTVICLTQAGWVEYDGPAATDDLGYVIAGTDANVIPQAPLIDPNRNPRRGRG